MKMLKRLALTSIIVAGGLAAQMEVACATLYTTVKSVVVQRNGYRVAVPPGYQFDFTSSEATYLLNAGVIKTPSGEPTFSTPTSGTPAGQGSATVTGAAAQITAFAANTPYAAGALVIFNQQLYQSKVAFTSVGVFDATNWNLIGNQTSVKQWAANTAYAANDLVINGAQLYEANTSFTSSTAFNASNWTLIGNASVNVLTTLFNRTPITPLTTTVGTTATIIYSAGTFAHVDITGTVEGVEADCTIDGTTPTLGSANKISHLGQHLRWPNYKGQIGSSAVTCIAPQSTTIVPYAD